MEDEERYDEDEDEEMYQNFRKRKRKESMKEKRASQEEMELVKYLEDINRKLSLATQRIKEPEIYMKDQTDSGTFVHMSEPKSKRKRKSNELLELLNANDGYILIKPKSKSDPDFRPRRSKSLPRLLRSKNSSKLDDALDLISDVILPRKSKSKSLSRKSSGSGRLKDRKSKSLSKLGQRRSGSLNKSLTSIPSLERARGAGPLSRRNSLTKIREKPNCFKANSFFIFGSVVIFGLIIWGIWSIIQDGIERKMQSKCQNNTTYC